MMPAYLHDLFHAFRERLSSRRTSDPIALSDLVTSVYADTMAHFDRQPGARLYRSEYVDRQPYPGETRNEMHLAGELWCYFTTHFFKVHQTLVELALPAGVEDLSRSIFGCSRLTILDVGAGVGTAALATIDVLHEWQRFLLTCGHVPAPVEVTVLPVEMNQLKLPVLTRMLSLAAEHHPYILKNLLLMLPHAGVTDWQNVAEKAALGCARQVVLDSFAWIKNHPEQNVLSLPDLEPPYTRKTVYPDLEYYPGYPGVSGEGG
jgi:hypothetical protein